MAGNYDSIRQARDIGLQQAGEIAEYQKKSPSIDETGARIIEQICVSRAGRILDVGCGDGVFSRRLARRLADQRPSLDFKVTGIDISPQAIVLANASKPKDLEGAMIFEVANAVDFNALTKFDAVVMFNLVQDVPREDVTRLLLRYATTLVPGGTLYVNFVCRESFENMAATMPQSDKYLLGGINILRIKDPVGKIYEIKQQTYYKPEVGELLKQSGLNMARLETIVRPFECYTRVFRLDEMTPQKQAAIDALQKEFGGYPDSYLVTAQKAGAGQ